MKKKIILLISATLLIILSVFGFNALNSEPVVLSNSKPMYGASSYKQYISNRTAEMKKTDETFIADTTRNQTKDEAIKGLVKQAWSALVKNDLDTALSRFNQVWLLDNENFNAMWGFGSILANQNELQKSADLFDKAVDSYSENKAVIPNDYLSLWDDAVVSFLNLSDTYQKTDKEKAKKYASKALDLLNNSFKQIDKMPKNMVPQEMFLLAVAYYNTEDYENARGAYETAIKQFPEIAKDSNAVLLESELKEKGV